MKVHVGMDTNGLAHSVVVTDASVHDSRMVDELMHGEEVLVNSDKDDASAGKKDWYEAEGVE
jgi:IS5 family transposase